MKTNHFKMLLNVFSTAYTYLNLNCIVHRLFYFWKMLTEKRMLTEINESGTIAKIRI